MASFVGTAGNDTITPALISTGVVVTPPGADLAGADTIHGNAGNDLAEGDSGSDVAFLGAGNDRFVWNPGDGDDIFHGQAGFDTLLFNGSGANERMSITTLSNGGFRFFRDVGDITVDTTRVERVIVNAGDGNDVVNGALQTNVNVSLSISGGDGDDRITGGAGRDRIAGGDGDDRMVGRGGGDIFAIGNETRNGVRETDTILGYSERAGDVVDLRGAGGFLSTTVQGGNLVVNLRGGDSLVIQGITNVQDVTFIL